LVLESGLLCVANTLESRLSIRTPVKLPCGMSVKLWLEILGMMGAESLRPTVSSYPRRTPKNFCCLIAAGLETNTNQIRRNTIHIQIISWTIEKSNLFFVYF
jgi:hypothetical protein